MDAIAHHCDHDNRIQYLFEHLHGTACHARTFMNKIKLGDLGELMGLLHDLGKYSKEFQDYLKSSAGILNPDLDDEFVDTKRLKGKIDHSTAGAQFVWRDMAFSGKQGAAVGQMLALCLASHHSGLIDCLTPSRLKPAEDTFSRRMEKGDHFTHLQEALANVDDAILVRIKELLTDPTLVSGVMELIHQVTIRNRDAGEVVVRQKLGLLVRFFFSCLIDADRIDSADFAHPERMMIGKCHPCWGVLTGRLERHLSRIAPKHPIDHLRQEISRHCREAAEGEKGIHTLTVPTGGGKTLASLRFALRHAARHGMDRVIHVIPFTSIIDQNAGVVRDILEPKGTEPDSVVLEHHSNLMPEEQTWRGKLAAENWNAPVIFTTSVQLLETLFGGGTRGARRMHQLANAVVIFDEIQALPIHCVHVFNNAINFLVEHCGSSVVLCTATQPLLHQVDEKKGALRLSKNHELMPDVGHLFDELKRVQVIHHTEPGGWTMDQIAELAIAEASRVNSCLVIVNTKRTAQTLFQRCREQGGIPTYHLSTAMCPAHRKSILAEIISRLKQGEATMCVSTQLIEAGVDVDFGAVIRLVAGLDAIAQAAGRCNRHGSAKMGTVHVIRPMDENLNMLKEIKEGRDVAIRVLDEYETNPSRFADNPMGPQAMEKYYEYYFYARKEEMDYKITDNTDCRGNTLLSILSTNSRIVSDYQRNNHQQAPSYHFRQSFMTAGKVFKAIDAPTRGVIVPYDNEGKGVIAELCSACQPGRDLNLLRRAQQYSVNLFSHQLGPLQDAGIVKEIQPGTGILYLADSRYYSMQFGLGETPEGEMEVICV